jgi:hypothetical protein
MSTSSAAPPPAYVTFTVTFELMYHSLFHLKHSQRECPMKYSPGICRVSVEIVSVVGSTDCLSLSHSLYVIIRSQHAEFWVHTPYLHTELSSASGLLCTIFPRDRPGEVNYSFYKCRLEIYCKFTDKEQRLFVGVADGTRFKSK